MKVPRQLSLLGGLVAVAAVIVFFAAFLLPRLIDSQLIKDEIQSEFLKKSAARVTFARLHLGWFPRPRVLIEDATVYLDDRTQGSIQSAEIYPSIFHLLTGRLVVRRALLNGPKFTVILPENSQPPLTLEELERRIRSALIDFTMGLPLAGLEIAAGSAEIHLGDKPPVMLENIAGSIFASPAEVRCDLGARSNLAERLRLQGKIAPQTLALQLEIAVRQLKIKELLTVLPVENSDALPHGEAGFEAQVSAVGLRKITASIDATAATLSVVRRGGTVTIDAQKLKGTIGYDDGAFRFDVERLDLGSPRLQASGTLKISADSRAATFNVRDGDLAELGELALRVADDGEAVQRLLRYVPAGTLSELKLHSSARTFVEMAGSKNLAAAATVRQAKVVVPGPDLEFTNVAASVRFADNILEASDITAEHGAAKAWNGKLRLGLAGKAAPFHLDIELRTAAPELQSVLLKLVADETLRKELTNVQKLEGELTGRLILGDTLATISPIIAVSKADISATYAPVPFPIKIRGARFDFDPRIIRLENAQGLVGRSSFAGLGVTWHQEGSRRFKVDSGRVSLDLQQTDALLRSFKALRNYVTELQSVSGQIDLQKLALSGVYDDPPGWTLAATGSFTQVEIERADFPGRMVLPRGRFAVDQGRIVFSDAIAALSDASFVGDGAFEYKRAAPAQFEARGRANIGAQMTRWLSHSLALPDAVKLQSPLSIAAKRFGWRTGGDFSFAGEVAVAGGPQLSVDMAQRPQALALQNLTIDDGGRRARITLQLAKERLALTFSGELTAQTLDKIFASFPLQGATLRGEIELSTELAAPSRFSARGQLNGNHLLLPWGADKVLIEGFRVEADGARVAIRSAALRWGQSQLTASGEVSGTNERIGLNLDVTGDQLDWQQLERSFGGSVSQRQQNQIGMLSMPELDGAIRFKLERIMFERFNAAAIEATADISPTGIRTTIQRAVVCGITTTGRVDVVGQDIAVDLRLAATDTQLEPVTICLTDRQNDIRGTYSLTARLSGQGHRDQLRSALKGDFQFTARDGEFVRSPGVDATFDYLNSTGDFKVAFPDLDRETFPYRFVGIKGRLDRNLLIGDEVSVESSSLNLSGQGRVDLERMEIDGKFLIAVLKPIDQVITRIPGIGSMLGGTLVGIPVRVSGSVERPDVSYLSAADIGGELLSIPLRILGLPLGAMRVFIPNGQRRDEEISK